MKYAIFRRDPRAQLLIDDSTGFRAVLVPAIVEIREDIAAELPRFRAIREKHGVAVPDDEEHLRALRAEGRVLLAITPDKPRSGLDLLGPGLIARLAVVISVAFPGLCRSPARPQPPRRRGPLVPPRLHGPRSVRYPAPRLPS